VSLREIDDGEAIVADCTRDQVSVFVDYEYTQVERPVREQRQLLVEGVVRGLEVESDHIAVSQEIPTDVRRAAVLGSDADAQPPEIGETTYPIGIPA
jgi:hypothetical protein